MQLVVADFIFYIQSTLLLFKEQRFNKHAIIYSVFSEQQIIQSLQITDKFCRFLGSGNGFLVLGSNFLVLENHFLVLENHFLVQEIINTCTRKPLSGTRKPFSCTGEQLSCTGEQLSCTGKPFSGTRKPFSGTGKPLSGTRKPFPDPRILHSCNVYCLFISILRKNDIKRWNGTLLQVQGD